MEQPFDSMAAPSQARLTVRNPTRAYSPENTTLLPGQRVRIQSNDGVTTRTHFTGFISHIEPLPGDEGQQTAIIHLRGPEHDLSQSQARLSPMQNVSADGVINTILDQAQIRRAALNGYLIIGVTGHNTIGTHKLFGPNIARALETGKSVFAYVGDTWEDGIPADSAIRQLAASERGRFFVNRNGEIRFYNRHHTLIDTAIDATFSDDMEDIEYVYGADIVNQVEIEIVPRSIGAADSVLWSLSGTQPIAPRATLRLVANYQDASKNPTGALNVIPPVRDTDFRALNAQGNDATVAIEVAVIAAGASAATLEVRSLSDRALTLNHLQLRGTPLQRGNPLLVQQVDMTSITFYGPNRLRLHLPALSSIEEADQMARYELARRKDPRGTIRHLKTSARSHATHMLARTLFDRITVTETQTAHSADYFILAEEHQVDRGSARHRVTWTLEPADDDRFIIIGASKPDGTRVLAY
jgi:hypothetical protein